MGEETNDWNKLEAAMLSLWHLGIVALHGVGSGRGDGIRACRAIYDEVGGADSGYLGFCFYRGRDAELAARTRCLELVCGDFVNKNLVTRKIQEVIKAALREVGLEAVSQRGSANKVLVRSFCTAGQQPLPSPPPLHVKPHPPDELVAATTAVPAASVPRRRSVVSLARTPKDPLDTMKRLVLGLAAPLPIPDIPESPLGSRLSNSRGPGPEELPPRARRGPVDPSVKRAVGIALIVGGVSLVAVRWGTLWAWIGGGVAAVVGSVVLVLGFKARPTPFPPARGC